MPNTTETHHINPPAPATGASRNREYRTVTAIPSVASAHINADGRVCFTYLVAPSQTAVSATLIEINADGGVCAMVDGLDVIVDITPDGESQLRRTVEVPATEILTAPVADVPDAYPELDGFKFGVEIEFVGPGRYEVASALHARNVHAVAERYNHVTRPHWKITTDSSVTATGGMSGIGLEAVSPILSGAAGMQELKTVCETLSSMDGVQINVKCGLHVHFSWDDMTPRQFHVLGQRYATFEDQIDKFMPRSRRARNNVYCRPVSDRIADLDRLKDEPPHGFRSGYRSAGEGRYNKVNFHAFSNHGTVEFRHHSGTTEFPKISNWVRFLAGFIKTSIQHATPVAVATFHPNANYQPRRKRAFADLRDQLEMAGATVTSRGPRWTIVTPHGDSFGFSTQQLSEAAYRGGAEAPIGSDYRTWRPEHHELDQNALNNLWRFLGLARQTSQTQPIPADDDVMAGVSLTVARFYAERANDLA